MIQYININPALLEFKGVNKMTEKDFAKMSIEEIETYCKALLQELSRAKFALVCKKQRKNLGRPDNCHKSA